MSCWFFLALSAFPLVPAIFFSPPPLPLTNLFCHFELWPHAPVQFFTGGLCFYLLFLRAIMTIRQPHEIFSSTQAAAFAGFTETPIIVGVQTCLSAWWMCKRQSRGTVAQLSRLCYLALSSKCVFFLKRQHPCMSLSFDIRKHISNSTPHFHGGGNWTNPLLERTMWKGPLLLTHLCNGSRAIIFPLTRTFEKMKIALVCDA